jgi:hypothetical protein
MCVACYALYGAFIQNFIRTFYKCSGYEAATATDLDEAKKLVSTGFEYVTDMNGIKLFRKPKRYVG